VRTCDAPINGFQEDQLKTLKKVANTHLRLSWSVDGVNLAAMGCEASKDRDPNVKHGNDTTDRFRVRVEHWTEEQYEGSSLPGKRYGALGQ